MQDNSEPRSRPPRAFQGLKVAAIVALLLTALGIYGGYALRSSCDVHAVEEASAFLISQLNFYDRVYQVAVTASRTVPDHPVNTMKQIFMDTQDVAVPACMRSAKAELVNYMGTVILAFDEYRAGTSDSAVLDLIRQSDVQYANFRSELRAVQECAPYCFRYRK